MEPRKISSELSENQTKQRNIDRAKRNRAQAARRQSSTKRKRLLTMPCEKSGVIKRKSLITPYMIDKNLSDGELLANKILKMAQDGTLDRSSLIVQLKGFAPERFSNVEAQEYFTPPLPKRALTWSDDRQLGESPSASAKAGVGQAEAEELKGEHSGRILRERQAGLTKPDSAALPTSYEEARAQVPGLRKWVEVKREAGLTGRREGFDQQVYDLLVQHLRDGQTGLGKWSTSEGGMPRNLLRYVDSGLRQELYSLGNPELPPDISLPHGPTGRPRSEEVPTGEQVREARRIASLGTRRGI